MLRCNSEVPLDPATESKATLKFLNSLQELRQLRSQIHNAADYCESAFKDAQEKKTVMDNTREYICKAVVAVVDHLGCVSANLGSAINQSDAVSEAELRINCLKQKVGLHGEYNHSLVLSRLSRRVLPPTPRHFSRYISPPPAISNQDKPEEQSSARTGKIEGIDYFGHYQRGPEMLKFGSHCRQLESCVEADSITKNKHEQDFKYTNTCKIPLYRSPSMSDAEFSTLQSLTSVLPVRGGLSIPQETKKAAFHFQMVRKHGRRILQWRIQDNDVVSRIRTRKESLKFLKF